MPRKIRQLKPGALWALRRAGFRPVRDRGQGSHTVWQHPDVSEAEAILSGADGDDAQHYQKRHVREEIARARRAKERQG